MRTLMASFVANRGIIDHKTPASPWFEDAEGHRWPPNVLSYYAHPRRLASPDRLSLRPPGRIISTSDPAAARAALPHPRHRVFTEGRTEAAFPELATGPAK